MKRKVSQLGVLFGLTLAVLIGVSLIMVIPAMATDTSYVSKWTEYTANPVFDPTEKAYYPTVIKVSDTEYRMWYDTGTGIYYTTSSNGIAWATGVPVILTTTTARHPHVEKIDDMYMMWYWDNNTTQLLSINAIRYADSTDGINWTNDQPITQVGTTVIATAGWNQGSYGPCDVLYNPDGSANITAPIDADSVWANKFVMYYDGTTSISGPEAIGLAVSADGKRWQGYNGGTTPVLAAGGVGEWDYRYSSFCTVIKESTTSYNMLYCGGTDDVNNGIGHATSPDGLIWTKDTNNPYLYKDDGVAWRNSRTYTPTVIKDSNIYKMWFTGKTGENYAIGYATNTNLDANYKTIQAAIDAANPGDTISIDAGTYNETFTVNIPLNLQGSRYGNDARMRDGTGETIIDTPTNGVIYLSANDIIMDGFTIESDTGSGRVEPNGNNIQFLNNIFKRTVYPRGNPSDMTFRQNLFRDTASTQTIYGTGLYFEPSSASGIVVEDNEFRDLRYSAIILAGDATRYTNTTIYDNDIYRTQSQGINVAGNQSGLTISDNYIEQANILHGADKGGIRLYGSNFGGVVNITNNIVTDSFNGICIKDGQNINGKNIHVNYNTLTDNSNAGVYNGGTGTLDATNNWWDSVNGPTHSGNKYNTSSQGSPVVGSVTYVPWLSISGGASFAPVRNGANSFASIQAAIDAAAPGNTITVSAGTYSEALIINKALTLNGDTTGARPLVNLPDGTGGIVTVQASNVSVNYLHFFKADQASDTAILNIPRGGSWPDYTIAYESVTFHNLIIENGRRGAFITGNNVVIDGCEFKNQLRDALYFDAVSGTTEITNNSFSGNAASSKKAILFESFAAEDPVTSGVINIENNTTNGKNNFFVFNQWKDPTVKVDIYILNNTLSGLGSNGIVIYDPRTDGAPFDPANLQKLNSVTVSHNNLTGIPAGKLAVINAIDPGYALVINATDNWWGTADGTAIAARITGNVNYDPWHLKQLSAVTTNQVTNNSIVLRWTAESVWSGNYYDFRYATTPINTATDWNNAKRIAGEPVSANGTQEMILRGLTGNTRYYFGLVLVDGNNSTAISKTDATTLTVAAVDNTAPNAATLGISAGSPASTSIVLTWTATGDDGAVGIATKYIIKRSNAPITAVNFDAATTVYNTLAPKANGQAETFTISNLSPNTRYYFAIKVQDEVPNTSTISNTVDILTADILPTISGIDPATGDNSIARTLTINGNNFAGAGTTTVRLVSGDNVLNLTSVTTVNATQLTAVVPKGAPTGTYRARVTNNNGTSNLSAVTYIITPQPVPLPVVTNAVPQMAASNTTVNGVEIFGENFIGATAVTINGHAATNITVDSATKITINVPGLAAGEYDIKVTTPAGTNDVSSVKFVVINPVVIDTTTTEDTTTSGVIDLGNTNVTPVQITMTTDNSENATRNTDANVEISVVIPPDTAITDSAGNPYTGMLNPPRAVKPDTTVQTGLPQDAVVIEMGNPSQTINFSQDFVAVVRVTATSSPAIYYYNKDTGKYELAGKAGVKDGINYVPGGTMLGKEDGTYTIGLLLDHMSVYVASIPSLLPTHTIIPTPSYPDLYNLHFPTRTSTPSTGVAPPPRTGTTNIQGMVNSAGRFLETVTSISADAKIWLKIPAGTVGLDENLKPLTDITIYKIEPPPPLPTDWHIIGLPYDFGPSGASFDPAITINFKFNPANFPENTDITDLVLAYYDEATGKWVKLNSTVNTINHYITAEITHFTTFAVFSLPRPVTLTIGPLNIWPTGVAPGEKVTISADVTDIGGKGGNYTAILQINDAQEAEESFTLTAGTSHRVSFDVVKQQVGTYNIKLNGLTGSFTVAPIVVAPTEPHEVATNWGVISGMSTASVVIILLLLYFLWSKRRLSSS